MKYIISKTLNGYLVEIAGTNSEISKHIESLDGVDKVMSELDAELKKRMQKPQVNPNGIMK